MFILLNNQSISYLGDPDFICLVLKFCEDELLLVTSTQLKGNEK